MKPPQLAGCHRSSSRGPAGLPGLLKGAATEAGGWEVGGDQGLVWLGALGAPSPYLRAWGERRP